MLNPKKIFITGGTGFVGSHLSKHLMAGGHQVTILSRKDKKPAYLPEEVEMIKGDPAIAGDWQEVVNESDWIINLSGEVIFGRWNDEKKKKIRNSRIMTTKNLVEAIQPNGKNNSPTLLSTSAVGFYGFHGDESLAEDDLPGDDWLAKVAIEWEYEALRAREKGARVIITRFGLILGKNGGMLSQLIPIFKFFLGGPLGNGKQWFSWVHLDDIVEGIQFVLSRPELEGPVNLCSPQPVRNKELTKILAKALHRPAFIPVPGFAIKLALGEFGTVILNGQKVIPKKLLDNGYTFIYPDLKQALEDILN